MSRKWHHVEGFPNPQGVTYLEDIDAYNFAIYSKNASRVQLVFFGENVNKTLVEFELNPHLNKTQRIWHILVHLRQIKGARFYAYRFWGPIADDGLEFHSFDPEKLLLDPHTHNVYFPEGFSRKAASRPGNNLGKAPLGVLPPTEKTKPRHNSFQRVHHDHDLIIYEMHVRQFTANPNSGVEEKHLGTYQGLIDKIPYLKELGITAVELMPIHQWDPKEGSTWGYMTLNYFAPHKQYSSDQSIDGHINEFKSMVDALHEAGINVILDVVYNHTTEGDPEGPTYSFKGIDNSTYYLAITTDGAWDYADFSGTGNTFYSAKAQTRRLILDSLRFWVKEMHVDGFRFDLGSIFALDSKGNYSTDFYSIIDQISHDPVLRDIILIAEPWDGAFDDQGYLLGKNFPGIRWKQWNDRARSHFRQFIKGDNGMVQDLKLRLYGSNDLFPGPESDLSLSNKPSQSLNYISSHDGLTLYDMVSYTNTQQMSWDCGHEGVKEVPEKVLELRKRQVKNFITLLMLSNGTPMFRAGDEFLQTQYGQFNPYNIDDETVWLDWSMKEANKDIFEYFKYIIQFRKSHPSISRGRFWQDDVSWFGPNGPVDDGYHSHTLAYHLKGKNDELGLEDDDLYVMFNAYWEPIEFEIFVPGKWILIADTSMTANSNRKIKSNSYLVNSRSLVVLINKDLSR